MEGYTINKYDFKQYLLNELPDTRQENFIFWKRNIPMPLDIIYQMFEKRGQLLSKYVDHLGAAFIFCHIQHSIGSDVKKEISVQPTKENLNRVTEITQTFNKFIGSSKVGLLLNEVADSLLLCDYKVNVHNLVDAICHEGRKYKRLYIPLVIRQKVREFDQEVLKHIGLSNWDMFSNVVADELKIYRMGFADAFSTIFNKLIDFILTFTDDTRQVYSKTTDIKLLVVSDSGLSDVSKKYVGSIKDGRLWEPTYSNSKVSFVINTNHPYFDSVKRSESAEQILFDFVQSLSELEREAIKDSHCKILENIRDELSRKLRLKTDN